jgi:hypothetical protein
MLTRYLTGYHHGASYVSASVALSQDTYFHGPVISGYRAAAARVNIYPGIGRYCGFSEAVIWYLK